jgi:hypothetical protein
MAAPGGIRTLGAEKGNVCFQEIPNPISRAEMGREAAIGNARR